RSSTSSRRRRSCTAAATSRTPRWSVFGLHPWRSAPPSRSRSRSTASRSGRLRRVSRWFHRPCGSGCPLRSAALAAAAAFAALAGLVASGATTHLDQWAADHAMPLTGGFSPPPTTLESLVPLLHAPFHPIGVGVAQIVTLPGQVVFSLLLVGVAAWRLW